MRPDVTPGTRSCATTCRPPRGCLLADEPLARVRAKPDAVAPDAPGRRRLSDLVRTLARARQRTHTPPKRLDVGAHGARSALCPSWGRHVRRSPALRADQPPKAACQASGSCAPGVGVGVRPASCSVCPEG